MRKSVKLQDVQPNKRYRLHIIDTLAPKNSSILRKETAFGNMLGSNVLKNLKDNPEWKIKLLEEQYLEIEIETSEELVNLYHQTNNLIETYQLMAQQIRKEMLAKPAGYMGHVNGGYCDELNNLANSIESCCRYLIKVSYLYAQTINVEPKHVPERWW